MTHNQLGFHLVDRIQLGADRRDVLEADAPAEAAVPTKATFTIQSSLTLASVAGRHHAFPDVARLKDGRLLVPLLVNVLEARLRLRLGAAAPALVMVGGFALRWIFVAAGQL